MGSPTHTVIINTIMPYKNLVITPTKYTNQDTVKESQFYRGFSTVNNTDSVNLFDQELIKQDLINHFNTRKGERLMNPDFGTIIWNLIYDPLTEDLKQDIKADVRAILLSDSRIQPIDVQIVEQDAGLLLEVTLVYANNNQTDNMKLSFDKEIGLVVQ